MVSPKKRSVCTRP